MAQQFLPVLITFAVVGAFSIALLGITTLTAHRPGTRRGVKGEAYEGGIPPSAARPRRLPTRFALVALVFVVMDVEIAFLYPWAVVYRESLAIAPWALFLDMVVFMLLLAAIYGWLWKSGVFDWGRRPPLAAANGEDP